MINNNINDNFDQLLLEFNEFYEWITNNDQKSKQVSILARLKYLAKRDLANNDKEKAMRLNAKVVGEYDKINIAE